MGAPTLVDRLVEDWSRRDRTHAFVKTDLDIIESTSAVRAFAAERLLRSTDGCPDEDASGEVDRDLLNAFGMLGRIVGERGGSPTLAVLIVDGARYALDALVTPTAKIRVPGADAAWVLPARAALVEAFSAARQDATRAEAATLWEYPRCAVGLHEASVAIVAGYPEDDADALAAWASRVARQAARAGVRRAVVSGSPAAEAALAEALEVAGVQRLAACAIGGSGHLERRGS